MYICYNQFTCAVCLLKIKFKQSYIWIHMHFNLTAITVLGMCEHFEHLYLIKPCMIFFKLKHWQCYMCTLALTVLHVYIWFENASVTHVQTRNKCIIMLHVHFCVFYRIISVTHAWMVLYIISIRNFDMHLLIVKNDKMNDSASYKNLSTNYRFLHTDEIFILITQISTIY